ncbi:MAG TPA: nuclear transport factor 2 family protein [Mycobacteriales bacterium]|nr:nuclear transport factor 2 family protein [Mycobacteriales bacterium]
MSSADRAAIRDLVESYALAVDRAAAVEVAALFVPDGDLVLFMVPPGEMQTALRHGRAEIATALQTLTRYRATHHTISSFRTVVDGDRATGETRCEAHHVDGTEDKVLYLHYLDEFARADADWRFARREVHARWSATVTVDG